jgi:prepilin-type N-terminal cleavage/methylation domain-containing protein
MFAAQPTRHRGGFTLVEMIVVITIMLMMAALGIALLPRFLDNQMQTRAVDQLTQWLLTAKQRAKRDGVPTGVRIIQDTTTGLYHQLEYVQQPDPYTGGLCQSVNATNNGGVLFSTVTLQLGGVDFEGAATGTQLPNWIVQAGDYLQLNGGGPVYLIQTVKSTQVVLVNTQITIAAPTPNYKIIRQPRRLLGEDILSLPQDIIVDFSTNPATGNPYSLNVPQRQLAGIANAYEILFAPSGAVLGQGTPSGKVILWVRNNTKPQSDPGAVTLVSIQIRTGFIAAHPISLGSDPYLFTEDGRSSGM